MGEWLWWTVVCAWMGVTALKFAAAAWCLLELRQWRPVPQLWSTDWLDVVYRVEHTFKVSLTAADFAEWSEQERVGLTAGQLWELVAGKLGTEVPTDGWERIVMALAEALNVCPKCISAESRLYADLGMVYGLE